MRSFQQVCSAFVLASLALSLAPTARAVAPTIDPFPGYFSPASVPVGKSLVVPVAVTNPDGGALTFKVTSSDARIAARIKTGNPILRLHVKYTGANPFEGDIDFQLFRDLAPVTSGLIGGFAQSGYYDNLIFHRVIKGFVAQAGDPLGTGAGGPGFTFGHEFQPSLIFSGKWQLAMANSGGGYSRGVTSRQNSSVPAGQIGLGDFEATNGSQFFITQSNQHNNLDFKHTIFGQLVRGTSLLDAIDNVPVNSSDKPTSNVTIVSTKLLPGVSEATVMLGALGQATSNITVTVTDSTGSVATRSFVANGVDDVVNNRPIMGALQTINAPVGAFPNISVSGVDLEGDFTDFGIAAAASTLNTSDPSRQLFIAPDTIGYAAIAGNYGVIDTPGVQTFAVGVAGGNDDSRANPPQAGIGLSGQELEYNPFETYSWQIQRLIFGDKIVRTEIAPVEATAGTAITPVVARFADGDPVGVATNFTASINWGDGSAVAAGTIARDTSRPGGALFAVSGTHTYARAGVYTVLTTLNWNVPGTGPAEISKVGSPAYVFAAGAALRADGTSVVATGPTVSNRILATFTDSNATRRAIDYFATVDWGDGVTSRGVVVKTGPGRFSVRGTHTYKDPEAFSIGIRIHRIAAADASGDATTWSTATVSGFAPPRHAPPFLVTHLHADWDDGSSRNTVTKVITGGLVDPYVEAGLRVQLRGRLTVANSGSKSSPGSIIRCYLSPDSTLNATGANADKALTVNGNAQITVGSFGPGASANTGSPFTSPFVVALPPGESGGRKYFLTQIVYSDPIIDHSAVPKTTVIGPLPATILKLDQTGSGFTTQSGGIVTFKVALDTKPTSNVTVPIVSTVPAQGTVSAPSLIFTAGNYNVPQLVTVTGVNDNNPDRQSFRVKVGPATSTDSLYSGLAGFNIDLVNQP